MAKAKGPGGRPSKYTPELADEICAAIASSELGLVHLVNQNPHWPDRATIFTWRRVHEEFRNKYAQAKEEQCEVVVEYMQEVMSEPHTYIDFNSGQMRVDVPMLRLKMDTMKWHASKLARKKFGDDYKETVENSGLSQSAIDHAKTIESDYQKDH